MTQHTQKSWLLTHLAEIIVIKFGGNAMVDDELAATFAEDIVALQRSGIRPVVTHGGGPQISQALDARGIGSEFRGGLRVTSREAVPVVREVLAQIGQELAASIVKAGGLAKSLAGDEENLFHGSLRGTEIDGVEVDLGRVGEVTEVNPAAVLRLLDAGIVPVISAVAPEREGTGLLNVNADSAASSLAVALGADRVIFLTDVPGLYRDWPKRESRVERINTGELAELLPTLESGMIPKMRACLDAVAGGVGSATILDGRVRHALVAEPFGTTGTTVVATERMIHA